MLFEQREFLELRIHGLNLNSPAECLEMQNHPNKKGRAYG